jgi:NAD(P) transhydrogenase subunit alpha
MKIGIVNETTEGERRVALIPDSVKRLKKNHEVILEPGAGDSAAFADEEFTAVGATVDSSAWQADVVLKIQKPTLEEIGKLREGSIFVSLLWPLQNPDLAKALAEKKVTAIGLESIPRTTLAQAMDVLSSQASLAGYWSVVAAAERLPKIFPLMMTPAGTISPSRILVMGAGVAGLQAIGTAKRLGGVVEATDVRPECKEQVESLGGKFLEVEGVEVKKGEGGYAAEQSDEYKQKQAEMVAEHIAKADVVITTALIPGRKAPILVTEEHLKSMRSGSLVVDLAAEQGGNCEGAVPGEDAVKHGVTIVGAVNISSRIYVHSSQVFSRNMEKLLGHFTTKEGELNLNMDDEIISGCVITHEGEVVHPKVKEVVNGS